MVLIGPALRLATSLTHPAIDQYEPFFQTFRSPFHACIDALMIGVLCAVLNHHRERLLGFRQPTAAVVLWAASALLGWLLLAAPLLERIDGFDKIVQPFLIALGAGGVLAGIVLSGRPVPILRGFWLFVLAKLSYSLYLVHLPLIPGLLWLVDGPIGLAEAPPALRFAAFLPLFVCASLVAAALLHYLVEKPFLLLKDKL